MIFKLLVFCLVSAVACEDPDSISKIGSTEADISNKATEPTYKSCVTHEGVNAECVPYYRCQIKEFIDMHVPLEEPCESYFDICCTPEDQIDGVPLVPLEYPFAEETKASQR